MTMPKNKQEFEKFVKEMGLLMRQRDVEIEKLKQLVGTELKLNAQIERYKKHLGNDLTHYEDTDIRFLHADFDDKLTQKVVGDYIEKSKSQVLFDLFSLMYLRSIDLDYTLALDDCQRNLFKEKAKHIRSPDRLQAKAAAFKINSASTPVYRKKLRSLKHRIIRRVNSKKVNDEINDAKQRTLYRQQFHNLRRAERDAAFGKGNRSNSRTPWYKTFITRTKEQKQLQNAYRHKYKTTHQYQPQPELPEDPHPLP